MACRIAAIHMTLSDLEGHFAVLNLCNSITSGNVECSIYVVFIELLHAALYEM